MYPSVGQVPRYQFPKLKQHQNKILCVAVSYIFTALSTSPNQQSNSHCVLYYTSAHQMVALMEKDPDQA